MKPERSGPKRRVVGVAVVGRRKVWLLECGHEIIRKASTPVPRRTHCPKCEELGKVPGPDGKVQE